MKKPPFCFRLLGLLTAVVAVFALASCGSSVPIGEPVPLDRGEAMRASLRSARSVVVYEGLPHQLKEQALMEREARRPDTTTILGYGFYTPPMPAHRQEELKRLLGDSNNYAVYSGPKTCGGFHPDYDVSWKSGSRTYHIQICYGCGEALFSDGGILLPYDIKHGPLAELMEALAPHGRKRPPVSR